MALPPAAAGVRHLGHPDILGHRRGDEAGLDLDDEEGGQADPPPPAAPSIGTGDSTAPLRSAGVQVRLPSVPSQCRALAGLGGCRGALGPWCSKRVRVGAKRRGTWCVQRPPGRQEAAVQGLRVPCALHCAAPVIGLGASDAQEGGSPGWVSEFGIVLFRAVKWRNQPYNQKTLKPSEVFQSLCSRNRESGSKEVAHHGGDDQLIACRRSTRRLRRPCRARWTRPHWSWREPSSSCRRRSPRR